jgi:hypothetical protein
MQYLVSLVVTGFLIILVSTTIGSAKRDSAIYCGACIALVDEMNWQIGQVDTKSTLQVGSFRVDSRGNQGLREIPLARSELHLTELLDDICRHMSDYAESYSISDGTTSYIRTSSRDGSAVSLTNVHISGEIHTRLKSACETLIEEHEEAILEAFRMSRESIEQFLCVDTMDVCETHNITDHRRAVEAAKSAAISKQSNREEESPNGEGNDNESDDDDSTETREDL